jgi:predicted GNAT family N-acyltransferase
MNNIKLGSWSELGEGAARVRNAVFVIEQRVPKEMELDAADHSALHVLICNALGVPLATGRLLQHAPGVGRIGRMAVMKEVRGAGLGRGMLLALVKAAGQRGDHEVMLHAQASAKGFYDRLGFVVRGEPFEEAGIDHIEMVLELPKI